MNGQDPEVPNGYREAIVTAITVILAFSLYFLRFWSFEAEGEWTVASLLAALLMVVSTIIQIVALGRSLRLADNDPQVYAVTLKVFMLGVALALASVVAAAIAYS
ncbi:hypothetical protein KEU06_14740 [Pseudaminobacter sp. 19-2017]|uniref:Uncharacterized protein n=1 Tax=Pseudaminobacter soli (ex Zhang et al. 2022) TaxID=2831468 RepID=A0A942DZ82_9HYPH|nr:hypothetical protein [Pseudaminobacter soli]MBS3649867.1 hypothetical protein [Pseudaminobacter soli]